MQKYSYLVTLLSEIIGKNRFDIEIFPSPNVQIETFQNVSRSKLTLNPDVFNKNISIYARIFVPSNAF